MFSSAPARYVASAGLKQGLHANCKGCPHIRKDLRTACRFVTHPKHRKWPCYFRVNVTET